jgi:hypothetical protein
VRGRCRKPSAFARWLLGSLLPISFREAMLGDLIEEYNDIWVLSGSSLTADCWFWSQTCRSLPVLLWEVLRDEPFRSIVVASGVYLVMLGLKYGVALALANFVRGNARVEISLAPITFAVIAALGGYVTARIRYQAIVVLTVLVIITVVALIALNACPIPVPWWYRPGFLALAPVAVLVPPAILSASTAQRRP